MNPHSALMKAVTTLPPPLCSNFEAISDGQIAETQSQYGKKLDHKLDHNIYLVKIFSRSKNAETQSPQGIQNRSQNRSQIAKIDHRLIDKTLSLLHCVLVFVIQWLKPLLDKE